MSLFLNRIFILALLAITTLGLSLQLAGAQTVQRIAAIVNDEAISSYDLDQRVKLVISASGKTPDETSIRGLTQQVLRSLVDERLKLQEARRFDIEITEDEIDEGINLVAKRNKVDRQTLIERIRNFGVSDKTLRVQIQSDLAWSKLVRGRFAARVVINDDEVGEIYERISTQSGGTQFQVSEIFLAIANADDTGRVRAEAQQLLRQLQEGANFGELAAQFSEGLAAGQGGNLGWVRSGQLDPVIDETLERIEPGMVAGPIQTSRGFHIIALRDRRQGAGAAPARNTKLHLKQIVVAVSADAEQEAVQSAASLAEQARTSLTSCDVADSLKDDYSPLSGDLGTMSLAEIPPEFRRVVTRLPKGGVSRPVRTANGFHILIVCERSAPALNAEIRDKIEQQLGQQQLAMMARRYLRDMRRDATIDVR